MARPFRFIVSMPRLGGGVAAWRAALGRIEDLAYSTIAISDHFTRGWAVEPLAMLAAAAAETEHIRLLTTVLGIQKPHPPIVVGGGGQRMLELAGRIAHIASVYANLWRGTRDVHPGLDMSPDSVAAKVEFVPEGGRSGARDPADVGLELSLLLCRVVSSIDEARAEARAILDQAALSWGVSAQTIEASPAVPVGTLDRYAELLAECRERYGFSYIHIGTDFEECRTAG